MLHNVGKNSPSARRVPQAVGQDDGAVAARPEHRGGRCSESADIVAYLYETYADA